MRAAEAVAFAVTAGAMEPLSAAVHRYIGHGPAWALHRSHHDGPVAGPELNDVIPAVSAAATVALFAYGQWGRAERARLVTPIAAGATLYGVVYAVIHDLYIHRRLPLLPARVRWLEPFRAAHEAHHRQGSGHWGILSRQRSVPPR
ncbi:MAG: hypothetical protein R2761_00820 [Acidimicrobiales bacterium]